LAWADAPPDRLTAPVTPPAQTGVQTGVWQARLPFQFEANQGQSEAAVKFLARGQDYTVFLTAAGATFVLDATTQEQPAAQVRLNFVGARPNPAVVGLDALPGRVNYYIGRDPARWQTGIPTFARVKYRQVYPGIDLVFYAKDGDLEHDFIVAPGQDPSRIGLAVEGATSVRLDPAGNLVIQTAGGALRLHKPVIYQEVDGHRRAVTGGYRLKDNDEIGFAVGRYDPSRPLVIDPVLTYSTYFGGSTDDYGYDIALDPAGNIYVTGATNSLDFPLENAAQPNFGGGGVNCPSDTVPTRVCYDAFVLKLNPSGSSLLYATYIGDPGDDRGNDIAVDAAGNAYITGLVSRNNVTLPEFYIYKYVLAAKLDPNGSLVYATYFGSVDSEGHAIAADASGNAYITGEVASSGFPVTDNAVQSERLELNDAFVSVLDSAGETLLYSTYLGGSGAYCGACSSAGYGITVDEAGTIYVTGQAAPSFPTTAGAYQPAFQGLFWKAFVAKIDPARAGAAGLAYATFLGGTGSDFGRSIARDAAGMIYIAGDTQSEDFPVTAGAYDPTCGTDGICNRPDSITCDPTPPLGCRPTATWITSPMSLWRSSTSPKPERRRCSLPPIWAAATRSGPMAWPWMRRATST
jgi:hypothetical protein